MIGPAEIEELLTEHASARPASKAPCWPVMRTEAERTRSMRREPSAAELSQAANRRQRRD